MPAQRFRSKPREITAEQWLLGKITAAGVKIFPGEHGTDAAWFISDHQIVYLSPGDWVVVDDGHPVGMAPDVFAARYEPVPEGDSLGTLELPLSLGDPLANTRDYRDIEGRLQQLRERRDAAAAAFLGSPDLGDIAAMNDLIGAIRSLAWVLGEVES